MSSLTLAVVSEDCFPLASLINVDRKFRHFFTFSSVSCKHINTTLQLPFIEDKEKIIQGWISYSGDGCWSDSSPGGTEGPCSLCDSSGHRTGLHCGGCSQWLSGCGSTSSQHDGVLHINQRICSNEMSHRKTTHSGNAWSLGTEHVTLLRHR